MSGESATFRKKKEVSVNHPAPIQLIKKETPAYPKQATLSCIEGHVQLKFTILTNGSVKDVVVTEAQPTGVFESTAIDAVSRWRFKPIAEEQGATQRLEFKFKENECKNA